MLFNLVDYGTPIIGMFSIFIFLPLSLLAFYLTPKDYRKISLLIISVAFLLFVAPLQIPTIVLLILINYLLSREMINATEAQTKYRLILFLSSLFINIFVWVFFTQTKWFRNYYYLIGGAVIPFLLSSINTNIYYKKIKTMPSFTDYLLHSFFFAKWFVGPFTPIGDYSNDFSSYNAANKLSDGFALFSVGAFQYIFLGVRLIRLSRTISIFFTNDMSILSIWIIIITLALGIYHTFFGVSRAMRGVARAFGYVFPTTKYYPFVCSSFFSFVRSFFGSLGRLIRNDLLLPIKTKKNMPFARALVALVYCVIVALWVDFSKAFFVWGLFLGLAIILEYLLFKIIFKRTKRWIKILYTALCIVSSFALLTYGYSGWNPHVPKALFELNHNSLNTNTVKQTIYYLSLYWFVILMGIIFATKLPYKVNNYLTSKIPKLYRFVLLLVHAIIFVLLISLLV